MKILKRFGAMLLSLLILFSVVACNTEDETSSTESSQQSESSSKESESSPMESESSSTQQTQKPAKWESDASPEIVAEAERLLRSKHKLTYNEDGSFRVLVLADVHMTVSDENAKKVQDVKDRIKMLVDKEKPNLVILTGDNTIYSKSTEGLKTNLDAIVGYIEEKQIPWCHTYGNHDDEYGALGKISQQPIYESYEYCISKDEDPMAGTGNYVHGVYKADGSLGAVIYCLDSGTYASAGGYDYIKDSQISWYKETSELLEEYNNGEAVKGIMAFHIPLKENVTIYKSRDDKTVVTEYSGAANEAMCPSNTDTTLLETILDRGDIKAIVTGHDHVNDYMLNYKGLIKLTSSPNISDLTYCTPAHQGARVFDLNASTMDNVPTYVSYIIERFDPDRYGKLDSNLLLEDCEDEPKNPTKNGWSWEGLSGDVVISVGEGKGANGSNAICLERDQTSNFEITFSTDPVGKLGDNKYVIVWMDFTNVEFRKACIGLVSSDGTKSPYRTDDKNSGTKFYYLADGSSQWVQLSHGWDGCFGTGDGGSQGMKGKKGYFAFSVDDLYQGSKAITEDTLVSGFYFYGSLSDEAWINQPFYIDDIRLVENYTEFNPAN